MRGGPEAYVHPVEAALSSFVIQRIWSNASIAAGHDPCVPALPGEVYYAAIPVAPDTILTGSQGSPTGEEALSSRGLKLPIGGQATLELALYSDGATAGPWSVSLQSYDPTELGISLSQTTGQNGSLIKVTLTAPPDSFAGVQFVSVSSVLVGFPPIGGLNTWQFAVLTY